MADSDKTETTTSGWMSDVQRALALILICTFAIAVLLATFRVVWWGDVNAVNEIAKTLESALVNMGLIALGFFFGNTVAQRDTNRGQQNILDRLAPSPAPSAPPALPTPPVPWWTKLTDDEKHMITGAKANDARVDAFVTSAAVGSATPDDLNYLVSRGLLTAQRAAEIAGS